MGVALLKPVLYSMRHAGPSNDVADRLRQFRDVKKRGRWAADSSVRRYEKAVFPLRMMLLQDEMNLRQFDRSQKLLTMLIRGGRRVGQLHFFRGETYRLRGGDGDLEKAMQSYRIAVERQAAPDIAYRSMGRVLDKLGKKAEARKAYRTYLEISPDAEDRKIIEFMLDGLS